MRKFLAFFLTFCIAFSMLALPAAAASDKVYSQNTNINSPFNGFDNVTVKAGAKVTLGKGGGLEVRKSLTVEAGGSIVGADSSSVLLFRGGSSSSGITLYYNVKGEIKELMNGVQRLWEKGYSTETPANFEWRGGKWVLEGESQVDNFGKDPLPPSYPGYDNVWVDFDSHRGGVKIDGVSINDFERREYTPGSTLHFVLKQPGDRQGDTPIVEIEAHQGVRLTNEGDAPTLTVTDGAFDFTTTADSSVVVRIWWSIYDKQGIEHPSNNRQPQNGSPSAGSHHKDNLTMSDEDADKLFQLGLFKGTGTKPNGTNEYELERAPKRTEALVMLIRLLGKEKEALEGDWHHPFTDAGWADKYVGYAYENGLTNGVSADKFGSDETASAVQFITFVLRAMGYSDKNGEDFTWDKPHELAMSAGFLTGDVDVENLWRADMAILSYNALHGRCKDGSELKDKLIADGVFSEGDYLAVSGRNAQPDEGQK